MIIQGYENCNFYHKNFSNTKLFLGSKPGEFTTSLRTITLEAPGDARHKREALDLVVQPSPVQPIHHTQVINIWMIFLIRHKEKY